MSEDTVDKVLAFFREIIAQLGPAGEQAYRIVYNRIIAESVIYGLISLVLIIGGPIIANKLWKWALVRPKNQWGSNSDSEDFGKATAGFIIVVLPLVGIVGLVHSGINLLSPDYAAIERILNLVGAR